MKKLTNVLLGSIVFGFVCLLSGCDTVLFHPRGWVAAQERDLIIVATLFMLIVVLPVIFLTFFFAWYYRASNKKAVYRPNWSHNVGLEVLWWTIPCVIIVILSVLAWVMSHRLDPFRPLYSHNEKPLVIQAVVLDWKWLFIYPDQHIATVNWVELPKNRPIQFLITADAPMNSLWIPDLGGQIYAMAGMRTQLHLIANEEGEYRGLSANFSGDGFSHMYFTVKSVSTSDFDAWVAQVQRAPQALTFDAYNALAKPSEDVPAQYFSSVAPQLYEAIVMKYMMPPMPMHHQTMQ